MDNMPVMLSAPPPNANETLQQCYALCRYEVAFLNLFCMNFFQLLEARSVTYSNAEISERS